MSPERLKELFESFKNALARLDASLKEDISKSSTIVDGVIQRFEFTFELAWKLLRLMLLSEGVESNTPRAVIKEAFQAKYLQDGDGWIDMLEDRNRTAHLYDETMAAGVYRKIKEAHFQRLNAFCIAAEKIIKARS